MALGKFSFPSELIGTVLVPTVLKLQLSEDSIPELHYIVSEQQLKVLILFTPHFNNLATSVI